MPYKDPQDRSINQVVWYQQRRLLWIENNGPCKKCGSNENLVIDHIDPSLKERSVSHIWTRRDEVRSKELEKCQVLCTPCHKTKTKSEQSPEAEHGTYRKYKKFKCRCVLCREANAQYQREYRNRTSKS